MHSYSLRNWQAQRSGPAITIHGDDADRPSCRVKLAGVTLIRPSPDVAGRMQAVMADGGTHQLLV